MFNIFKKSKPKLSEIIPNGFIDIHSHVLPGVDDGAKNIKESFYLISEMKKLGFKKIISTPHIYPGLYDNTNESIKLSYSSLKKVNNTIQLDYASEYLLDYSLISKAKKKTLLTLKNNYILVEMSFLSPPQLLYDIIFKLQLNGYIPILAHPERYLFYGESFDEFFKLKNAGCKFQLNLLSKIGFYGLETKKLADKLLKLSLIDFVGSDIHNSNHILQFHKEVDLINLEKLQKAMEANNVFKD